MPPKKLYGAQNRKYNVQQWAQLQKNASSMQKFLLLTEPVGFSCTSTVDVETLREDSGKDTVSVNLEHDVEQSYRRNHHLVIVLLILYQQKWHAYYSYHGNNPDV